MSSFIKGHRKCLDLTRDMFYVKMRQTHKCVGTQLSLEKSKSDSLKKNETSFSKHLKILYLLFLWCLFGTKREDLCAFQCFM